MPRTAKHEEWMPSKAPCYYCGEKQASLDAPLGNGVGIAGLHEIVAMTRIDAIRIERERCAKIAESVGPAWEHCGAQIAATIRRGE